MLSNEVPAEGESADALLLTPKARVIAPLLVWRAGSHDVLLLTEPELAPVVADQLLRARFAAKCEISVEEHTSAVVFGPAPPGGIPTRDYGSEAHELLDAEVSPTLAEDELERLRIAAGTPRFGREIDDRVMPAEAGLEERAISFTKGCYPGQEPVARQHHRGKVNRILRVLDVAGRPGPEEPVMFEGKDVGRITSAVDGLALAYVRVEVPGDAVLEVAGAPARLH
jgi:folate-binding protein YgfZ